MNDSASLPLVFKNVAILDSLESKLNNLDLSLGQIEEIEHQILNIPQVTKKIQEVTHRLLNECSHKKSFLVNRKILRMEGSRNLPEKIKLLIPLIGYLEPERVDKILARLRRAVFVCGFSPKMQAVIEKQLLHLEFTQANPIVYDLEDLAKKMRKIAREVLSSNSLTPMRNELNCVQLQEIESRGCGDSKKNRRCN